MSNDFELDRRDAKTGDLIVMRGSLDDSRVAKGGKAVFTLYPMGYEAWRGSWVIALAGSTTPRARFCGAGWASFRAHLSNDLRALATLSAAAADRPARHLYPVCPVRVGARSKHCDNHFQLHVEQLVTTPPAPRVRGANVTIILDAVVLS